nr:MAG TPA: hypothetical protein [Caudoviricetes sp.]
MLKKNYTGRVKRTLSNFLKYNYNTLFCLICLIF